MTESDPTTPSSTKTLTDGGTRPLDASIAAVGWMATISWWLVCAAYLCKVAHFRDFLAIPTEQLGVFFLVALSLPSVLWGVITHRQRMAVLKATSERLAAVSQDASGGEQAKLSSIVAQLETRIAAMNALLSGHREGVEQSTDISEDRLQAFERALAERKQNIDSLMNMMMSRLDEAASRFDTQISTAGNAERQIVDGLELVGNALARTRVEQDTTMRALETMAERTSGLTGRLEGLRTAAIAGANDLIGETDRLQRRTEALSHELRGHNNVINGAVERASEIGAVLQSTGTVINEIAGRATEASRQIRDEFDRARNGIEAEGMKLVDRARDAGSIIDRTRTQLEDVAGTVASTFNDFDHRAGEINFSVVSSLSRLSELTHGLERARDQALGSTDQISGRLDDAIRVLQNGVGRIESVAGAITQASAETAGVTSQLSETGEALRGRMDEVLRMAAEAKESLRATSDAFAGSTQQTRGELMSSTERLRQEAELVSNAMKRLGDVQAALLGVGATVSQIGDRTSETADQAAARLHAVGEEIAIQAGLLSSVSGTNAEGLARARGQIEGIVGQVDEAFGNLNRKTGEITFTVSSAVNRLNELMRGLESAKAAVESSSGVVADRIAGTASAMKAEFDQVQDASDRAIERLERTASVLAAGAVSAESETQAAEARISNLLGVVNARNAEVAKAVDAAIAEFERAERNLADAQNKMTSNAIDSTAQFKALMSELANGKFDLGNTISVVADRIAAASSLVENRLGSITRVADEARSALTTFSGDVDDVSARGQALAVVLTGTAEHLKTSVATIADTAEHARGEIQKSATALVASNTDIADAAGRARVELQRAVNQLREENRAISETGDQAAQLAGKAAAMLGEKVMELAQAARSVANEAVSLRDTDTKTRRDIFLNAAKSVLDGLQALSVDLAKVLDKELPEKTWRNATRADLPTFTKRLATLRDTMPVNEVRTRFMADTQFRINVQAYLRQFEELMDQINADENGEILASALMSSDVGKIYYFLSSAVGRDRTLQQTG
jgi:ABC-type transporter Mla subunit MlaD